MSHYDDIVESVSISDTSHWVKVAHVSPATQELVIDSKVLEDVVNHPSHYTSYPGVEVIQLTEHMNFCKGNAIKYIARAEFKGTEVQDLQKAIWYLNRELERIENKQPS